MDQNNEHGPQPHMVAAEDYAAGLKVELDRAMDELAKARGLIFAHLRRIAELEAEIGRNEESLAKLAGTVGDKLTAEELEAIAAGKGSPELADELARRIGQYMTPAELAEPPDRAELDALRTGGHPAEAGST